MSKSTFDNALRQSIARDFSFVPDNNDLISIEFSANFEKKMNKLIKCQKKSYWTLINTVSKRVAIFLIAFTILFVSMFSVDAIGDSIVQFFTKMYDTFVAYFFEGELKGYIEYEYNITELPEGFELKEISKGPLSVTSTFSGLNGGKIYLDQTAGYKDQKVNNEKVTYSQHEWESIVVDVYEGEGIIYAIWMYDGYSFFIYCIGDFELNEVKEMILSVK